MFTGLVSHVGRVREVAATGGVTRFTVACDLPATELRVGDSVAHSGVCLTLVDVRGDGAGALWAVEAVAETLARTTLGRWRAGDAVNIERSLKVGDELGGHFVAGHVDGVGEVIAIAHEGASWRVRIGSPPGLARFLAVKGSIAVDGVSLTLAGASPAGAADAWFEVAVIPHTLAATTLGGLSPGAAVNLEADLLARYVARMLESPR
jgi:riboflavin synthase